MALQPLVVIFPHESIVDTLSPPLPTFRPTKVSDHDTFSFKYPPCVEHQLSTALPPGTYQLVIQYAIFPHRY